MKNPQQPLIDLESRYDGPYPAAIREQMGRHPDPKVRRRAELESVRDRAAAELTRLEFVLSLPGLHEENETFANIDHRAATERLKFAEIFLKRYK